MFIDDEKRILSNYINSDTSLNNGLENFEWIIVDNINNSGKFDNIYRYNRDNDRDYIKEVYERIVLFTVNQYFSPNHKLDRKYMRNSELCMSYYIYLYFDYILRYKKNDELNHFTETDEYGYTTYKLNKVGKVAVKAYLASAIVLNKNGLLLENNVESAKDCIRNNRFIF